MKDGQRVGTGNDAFDGCGMDVFLASKGIDVNAKSFSVSQITNAMNVSIEYWDMISIHHAAAALREFKTRVFEPAAQG